jgi:prepilin-type N-terminal cleavage/methylation domain-containing protein
LSVARGAPSSPAPPLARGKRRAIGVRAERERGETLVEILITIVVIGIVGSAAFFAISVGATNSKSQRDFVTADQLLRNSAEKTKDVVRNACSNGGTTYSVAFSTLPAPDPTQTWHQYYEVARNFTLPTDLVNQPCPATTGPMASQVPVVALSVTLPSGMQRSLSIVVRTP